MDNATYLYLFSASLVMFAVTFGLRCFSFATFGRKGNPPEVILYIGKAVSPAIICILIFYCFRNVSLLNKPHGIPELIAIAVCIMLHLWKRNALLSIISSTVVYMLLLQKVFV